MIARMICCWDVIIGMMIMGKGRIRNQKTIAQVSTALGGRLLKDLSRLNHSMYPTSSTTGDGYYFGYLQRHEAIGVSECSFFFGWHHGEKTGSPRERIFTAPDLHGRTNAGTYELR